MRWDVGSVNSTPAHGSSARTFLTKASSSFTELKRRKGLQTRNRVCRSLLAADPSRINFSTDVQCTSLHDRAFVVLLALGFILSAILSWIFDITPQGIKRTADLSPDEAVEIVRQLEAHARQEFVRGYLSALIYAGLGDKTKAIDYLKREYLNHGNINPTGVDAMLDGMQGDPRFEALLGKPQ